MVINREQQCNDNFGGISNLYMFEYKRISRSKIKVVENFLTEFPYSVIYDINASQVSFTEQVEEQEGGVTYAQSGTFQLKKILPTDNYKDFVSKDWRIIIKDNNGYIRLIGLETGLKIKYTKETGTNIGDFNGLKFSFETKEEASAPFITDLNGFAINTNPFWVEGNNFIVDNNNNKIEVKI